MLKPVANGCGTRVFYRTDRCHPRVNFMNLKYKYSYLQEPGYLDVCVKVVAIFLLINCTVLPFVLRRPHKCTLCNVEWQKFACPVFCVCMSFSYYSLNIVPSH
jgi:hypothetical protein